MNKLKSIPAAKYLMICLLVVTSMMMFYPKKMFAQVSSGRIAIAKISGTINPATDDYLKTSLRRAKEEKAKLFILMLNTPGGLLSSMQTMVESLLEAEVPTVVFVYPSGGAAISAGVFVTMAGHFAAMAPGTSIGAAHPVLGTGGDLKGDMREKVENFSVSLIKAIAEQRNRNVRWAEKAVRESVAITDRQAVDEKVVDFSASDLDSLLGELEGKTIIIQGKIITLRNLRAAQQIPLEMNLKQKIINILSDPNIAILLALGAILGIGIELFHPGAILPGIVGVICLLLLLTSVQVLPISYGGLVLLLLGAVFFIVEMFVPSFGIWGFAGVICMLLGSIYFLDSEMIWSDGGYEVNKMLIGSTAVVVGLLLALLATLIMRGQSRRVSTGKEGLIGKSARVKSDFQINTSSGECTGIVEVMGERWRARVDSSQPPPVQGEILIIEGIEESLVLFCVPEVQREQKAVEDGEKNKGEI